MEYTSAYDRGYRSGYFWGRHAELHGEPYDERPPLLKRRAEENGEESNVEGEEKDA